MQTVHKTDNRTASFKASVSTVKWRDLRQLSKKQIVYNVLLPYPFLLMSWGLASQGLWPLASLASYFFFASAFRQAHDGYHRSLGVSRRTTTLLTYLLSILLLTGLHSIKATHMQHHRDPLGSTDIEGSLAKLNWLQALLQGIQYRLAIYQEGLRLSSASAKRLVYIEFISIGIVISTIILGLLVTLLYDTNGIYATVFQIAGYHLLVMMLANACVGLIAVWGVHHDTEQSMARTERNNVINLLTFGLLFHVEHHLFPAVPTNHLPILAKRIDEVAPHLTQYRVVPLSNSFFSKLKARRLSVLVQANNNHPDDCPLRKLFA